MKLTIPRMAGLLVWLVCGCGSVFAAGTSGVVARAPIPAIWWLAPVGALLALAAAAVFYIWMKKQAEGDATQIKIAAAVRSGASIYLKQQYKVVAIVFRRGFLPLLLLMAVVFKTQSVLAPFCVSDRLGLFQR